MGEVEAEATRLEADEEDVALAVLEGGDGAGALFLGCCTDEILMWDPARLELLADEIEVVDELAEDERSVPTFAQLVDERSKRRELGGTRKGGGALR